MKILKEEFENRKIYLDKLIAYGFKYTNNKYQYNWQFYDNKFELVLTYHQNEFTQIINDLENDNEYLLVGVNGLVGSFSTTIKNLVQEKINDIIEKCTSRDIYQNKITKQVIEYIQKKYQNNLEFLWNKFPSYSVARHKSNNKWYAVIMVINASKLGIYSNDKIEVINLKHNSDDIPKIIDNINIFKAYHMNKNHWISIILNDKIKFDDICNYIDISYNLL